MLPGLRMFVMSLMALALPIQGMAAAFMPTCAPTHHSVASTKLRAAVHSIANQGSSLAALDHHSMGHDMAVENAAGDDDHGAGGQSDCAHTGHDILKCCSASVTMAAVTTSPIDACSLVRSPAPLQPVADLYRGITLDGLDRPPKPLLA